MFVCGVCNSNTKPGQKAVHMVTETRRAVYPYRKNAHPVKQPDSKAKFKDDPGGKGIEIAKEVLLCPGCAKSLDTSNSDLN